MATLQAAQQRIGACRATKAQSIAGVRVARVVRSSKMQVQARANGAFLGQNVVARRVTTVARTGRALAQVVYAVKDGAVLDRPLRVAVIGGGPSGACAAETLAKGGIETYLIERKLDNCKAGSIIVVQKTFMRRSCGQACMFEHCSVTIALSKPHAAKSYHPAAGSCVQLQELRTSAVN